MSAAAHTAIKEAINKGIVFDDPTGKTVVVVSTDESGNEVRTTKRIADVPEVPDPRHDRPNGMYTFRNPDGTTFQRLHTNACAKCSLSFQWCYCPEGTTQFPYPYVSGQDGVYATLDRVPGRMVITTDDVPDKQPQQGTRRGRPRKRAAKAA